MEGNSWWRALLRSLWIAVALLNVVGLFAFISVQALQGRSGVFVWAVIVLGLLAGLALLESTEMATSLVTGLDPEQAIAPNTVAEGPRREAFYTGATTLITLAVIALALSAQRIFVTDLSIGGVPQYLVSGTAAALQFTFPTFIVLWLTQLYPRQEARLYPVAMLKSFGGRATSKTAVLVGQRLAVEAPADILTRWRERWGRRRLRTEALSASKDGLIYELQERTLTVAIDGSAKVRGTSTAVYGKGRQVTRAVVSATDKQQIRMAVRNFAVEDRSDERRAVIKPYKKQGHGNLHGWKATFRTPPRDGAKIRVSLEYDLPPKSLTQHTQHHREYVFRYIVDKPTRELTVYADASNMGQRSFRSDCRITKGTSEGSQAKGVIVLGPTEPGGSSRVTVFWPEIDATVEAIFRT